MNRPLISIITPAFNCRNTIGETYNSICLQSYDNWEWIITDDQSSDDTYLHLVQLSKNDRRIKVLRNKQNEGAAVSRNKSINFSDGEYLAFIDSDDLWHEDKLLNQVNIMMAESLSFTFTAYGLIDVHGNSLGGIVDSKQKEPLTYEDMLRKKATLGCSTVMLKRSSFDIIEMPLIRTGQDYALWLKLLKTGVKAYPITEVLTQYRILPDSISRNKIKKAKRQWQIYREIEKLSLLKSLECFCFYAWRAVFRK
ncbi:glycosyltransferase family 2 protein [Aliivibrio fischeri]|uniref:glycosyltransferase family 2 protein n=1 Tax=Aliivibrio fischeri TaxID=668 RepID=UPI0012DA5214|nr:glycosyltransferase family 2 protein [Aliivibrio fischeri]MUJ37282.1 glycosyltransferase [Aliivibrio fischeri]